MTDWNQHEDAIDDAISDSIDMDWTSRTGAKAVVAWLNENATSMTRDAEHTPSPQSVVVPVEPTPEMLACAEQASQMLEWQIKASWSAMLAAAPAPSSLAGGEGVANHDCLAKRREGEPMFILLGRDPDAHTIVRLWADRRLAAGGDPDHCRMGYDTAERMAAYASDPANRPASAPPAYDYPILAALSPEAPARERVLKACADFQEAIDYFEADVADALAEDSERADLWDREVTVNIDALKTVMRAALTPRHEAPACTTCGGKGYTEHEGGDGEGYPSSPEIEDCPRCHEAPAEGAGESLLRPAGSKPSRCYCPPDRCDAPVIMGRQTPCIRARSSAPEAREVKS